MGKKKQIFQLMLLPPKSEFNLSSDLNLYQKMFKGYFYSKLISELNNPNSVQNHFLLKKTVIFVACPSATGLFIHKKCQTTTDIVMFDVIFINSNCP